MIGLVHAGDRKSRESCYARSSEGLGHYPEGPQTSHYESLSRALRNPYLPMNGRYTKGPAWSEIPWGPRSSVRDQYILDRVCVPFSLSLRTNSREWGS